MDPRGLYWAIVQLAAIAAGIYAGVALFQSITT
jgi:hypothetical protein